VPISGTNKQWQSHRHGSSADRLTVPPGSRNVVVDQTRLRRFVARVNQLYTFTINRDV